MKNSPSRHAEIAMLVAKCTGFEWDAGNSDKNLKSHNVSDREAEEVFVNRPILFTDDRAHSTLEPRYVALSKSNGNRLLSVVFTIRQGNLIRVISAHDMSKKNRQKYGTQST